MIALAVALVLAAAPPQEDPERYLELPGAAAAERPAILLRTPAELPRAQPGAWDAFADEARREQVLADLGAETIEALARAERAYLEERYPAALAELYAVLERRPDLPPALMLLGTAYFRLRRYGDAATALERFLEVAPGEVWRTQALAHCRYSLGDYAGARAHYERLIAATPESVEVSPEALRGLALCHMRQGESDAALALLDRVIALRPDHPSAHATRARILHDEGRLDVALAAADRARAVAPFDPQPWYFTVRILYDLGRDDEARAAEARWRELDRAAQERRGLEMQLRYRPGAYPILMRLAEVAGGVGDVHALRARLAQALLARPPEVSPTAMRILVLDALESHGDLEGARVAALALEDTCAQSRAAWERLERYYAARKDRVNQVRCAARAAALAPDAR